MTADQETLSCVSWDGGRADDTVCNANYLLDSTFPKTPVNPDSRHLSAALISADYNDGMLLVYEDISNVVNIMWRSTGGGGGDHGARWHNLTSQFLSSASSQLDTTATRGTLQFTGTCSPSMSTVGRWLYCFTRNGTAPNTLGIIGLSFYPPSPTSSGLEGQSESPKFPLGGRAKHLFLKKQKKTNKPGPLTFLFLDRWNGRHVRHDHRTHRRQIQKRQPDGHYDPRRRPSHVDQRHQSARRSRARIRVRHHAGAEDSVSVSQDGQCGGGEWDADACVSSVEWLGLCGGVLERDWVLGGESECFCRYFVISG